MKKYIRNWNFIRITRLVLGVFILGQGIRESEWIFILFGALFTLMPMLNVGCCAGKACGIPLKSSRTDKSDEVIYEEIK